MVCIKDDMEKIYEKNKCKPFSIRLKLENSAVLKREEAEFSTVPFDREATLYTVN